jgi:hypothetical protein
LKIGAFPLVKDFTSSGFIDALNDGQDVSDVVVQTKG